MWIIVDIELNWRVEQCIALWCQNANFYGDTHDFAKPINQHKEQYMQFDQIFELICIELAYHLR